MRTSVHFTGSASATPSGCSCGGSPKCTRRQPDRVIGVYPVPTVVRLVTYVVTRWRRSRGPAWSRAGVLVRDGRRCGYCGRVATTIDHVLPRSRGGANSWLNTVAACGGCNQRKGDRTPSEARMPLRTAPAVPTWAAMYLR